MKNYLVIGLGRSGISATNHLVNHSQKVFVYDNNKKLAKELILGGIIDKNVKIVAKLNKSILCIIHCIVLSPGVKLSKKLLNLVQKFNIEIIGELAYANKFNVAPIFAITGTNGKTSTVNFLNDFFNNSKLSSYLLGNVGVPFSESVDKIQPQDKIVLEVSSFQLEYCQGLKVKCGAILNIAPDHLDRYSGFREYCDTKKKLLDCVDKDGRIFLNYDQKLTRLIGKSYPQTYYFSTNSLPSNERGICIIDNQIVWQENKSKVIVANLDKLNLKGEHNLSNLICAVGMALYGGVSEEQIQSIIPLLKTPKHRMDFVGTKNGVNFFDDSKATNIHSVQSALKSFTSPIWLLLGGSDKGESFDVFFKSLPKNVIGVVAFGKNGKKIYKSALKNDYFEINRFKSLEKAFDFVKKEANSGDTILLSPACASFDEFQDYQQRGDFFCKLVAEWISEV